jgi:23S rRNA (adenine2503-C2)-methyltransferase
MNIIKIKEIISSDGSIKRAHKLNDGNIIESIIIPHKTKINICISSQVGCRMGCCFCATGKIFVRNLSVDEIVSQIDVPVDSVVFMGMGEPLDNPFLIEAIERIIKEKNIPSRKITVSTCGLIDKVDLLLATKVNLAFSLNATDEKTRSKLMPINKKFSLKSLSDKMFELEKKLPRSRRVEIEYVMIKGINDTLSDAMQFSELVPKNSLINLIPLNATNSDFTMSDNENIIAFKEELRRQGFICFIRESKGKDVNGACGMLSGKTLKQKT